MSLHHLALFVIVLCNVRAKIYDRCELARELRDVHEISDKQIPTWLCIIYHESNFNTSAHNVGSGDHGLFQISQLYWCSSPGSAGYACGVDCSALRDEDIEDDVVCARRIFRQHKLLTGDGFSAWVVYNARCRDVGYVGSFVSGCFGDDVKQRKIDLPQVYYTIGQASFFPTGLTSFNIFSEHGVIGIPRRDTDTAYSLLITSRGFSFKNDN